MGITNLVSFACLYICQPINAHTPSPPEPIPVHEICLCASNKMVLEVFYILRPISYKCSNAIVQSWKYFDVPGKVLQIVSKKLV